MKVLFLFALLFSSGVYAGFDEIVGKPLELPKGIKYETGCLHDGDAVLSMTVKEFDEKLLKSGWLIQGAGDLSEISSENVVELMVEKFCDKPKGAKLRVVSIGMSQKSAQRLSVYLDLFAKSKELAYNKKLWEINDLVYEIMNKSGTLVLYVSQMKI